jgi:hypothetical protein
MKDKQPEGRSEAPVLLLAQLLYDHPATISADGLRDRLAVVLPHSKIVSNSDKLLLIAHEDHRIELKDGKKIPGHTAVLRGDSIDPATLSAALNQAWSWPDARHNVGRSTHHIAVTEMLSSWLDPQTRVKLFYNVLLQLLEIAPPLAVHCHHAESIVDPARIVRASGSASSAEQMTAFVNVRLFRIENAQAGDMVMDTRGLAALGLPDLQVHFHDLEPGRVAAVLYNSALYIYANGDCIKDGHTIQGLTPDQKWRCQHEDALVAPKRVVIDLDPGELFAAGARHRGSNE